MPKTTNREIHRIFSTYYDQRYPVVQSALQSSNMIAGLAAKTGKVANMARKIASTLIPQAAMTYALDRLMVHRPIASFLPPPPARGKVLPRTQSTWSVHHAPSTSSSSTPSMV
ncbi:hypothetical protein DFQ26_003073 [Actinomortierella ambigua]|nr:hypothetical protein DFQ26_003073 [Actinomortierella ambigua]